jgi:RHS repeat-associated protein
VMRTDNTATPAKTYYYYQDHEGSVTHVANGTTLAEQYRYDAFGAPTIKDGSGNVITTSAIGNRFLFTGREYQSTFGIYEYRNRAYHPGLGRFISEDPKGFGGGDYNLFRYCKNDPEDLTDPMGLDPGVGAVNMYAEKSATGQENDPRTTIILPAPIGSHIPIPLDLKKLAQVNPGLAGALAQINKINLTLGQAAQQGTASGQKLAQAEHGGQSGAGQSASGSGDLHAQSKVPLLAQGLFPVDGRGQPYVPSPGDPAGFPYHIYIPGEYLGPGKREIEIKEKILKGYEFILHEIIIKEVFGPFFPHPSLPPPIA